MDKVKLTKKYVLTGSAYSGKTTTIHELARYGFVTVPEAATIIISEQLECGGMSLPWLKFDNFLEALMEKQLELESKIQFGSEIAFVDRGIPDVLAYFKYVGIEPTLAYAKAFQEHRYDGIFLLDSIPGYQQDKIRREPLQMVQRLRILHEEAYWELGYDMAFVPVMSIAERVKFIIDRI